MRAVKFMTFGAATISPDASIRQAAYIMQTHRISGLPVVEDKDKLVGMVTESDLLEAAIGRERDAESALGGEEGRNIHVRDVMSRNVVSVSEDATIQEIVAKLRQHGIRRLPVVSDGRIIGIVSRADLLRSLAREVSLTPAATDEDYALRDRVLGALEKVPKAGWLSLNVLVESGVIELRGAMTDETLRQSLLEATRKIAGEYRVEDHLVVVGPASGRV